jgi:hypothetical protein
VFLLEEKREAEAWSAPVKKRTRKNPHAVALGRLGGLVRSEAKKRASPRKWSQGRPGQKPQEENCRPAKRPAPAAGAAPQGGVSAVIASIRARFGYRAIGLGYGGIRFSARALR